MNFKGTPSKMSVGVSRKRSDGEYGSYEVSASIEANLAPDADLEKAFDELDTWLTAAVASSMNEKSQKLATAKPVAAQAEVQPPLQQQPQPNWCFIHNCEMKMHEKDGSTWYSHKDGDAWCKGK